MPAPPSTRTVIRAVALAAGATGLLAQVSCSRSAGEATAATGTGDAAPAASVAPVAPVAPEVSVAPAAIGATSWPIFRGNQALTGVAAGSLPDSFELLWTFAAEEAIVSSPAVVDGRVYFGSDDGHVYCLDVGSGEKIWAFKSEDIIEAPPLVHDGGVYVGSSDFFFYALDADTGELRWKFETEDRVLGGANWVAAPGAPPDDPATWIVVGSYDSKLHCLDAETGTVQWTYTTDNYINGTPVVAGDKIMFGGCDSALHVVSASTGEAVTRIELCDECHIAGSVALDDGAVYFGHYGNAFICVDLATEEIRWTYPNPRFPFFSSPSIGESRVVFGGRDKHLHCANRADGTPLWVFKTRRKVDGSPVICGDKVVFGSGDGTLNVLWLDDGALVWSYDLGRSLFSSPAVYEGVILVGCNDGRMYAFGEAEETKRLRDEETK